MIFRKKTALKKLKKREISFYDLPKRFRNDKKFILEAVKQDGYALQYASDDLKLDIDVVRAAIKQNKDVLELISSPRYLSKDSKDSKEDIKKMAATLKKEITKSAKTEKTIEK